MTSLGAGVLKSLRQISSRMKSVKKTTPFDWSTAMATGCVKVESGVNEYKLPLRRSMTTI